MKFKTYYLNGECYEVGTRISQIGTVWRNVQAHHVIFAGYPITTLKSDADGRPVEDVELLLEHDFFNERAININCCLQFGNFYSVKKHSDRAYKVSKYD